MSDVLSGLAWYDFLEAHGLEWLPVYWDIAVLIIGIGGVLIWLTASITRDYIKERRGRR